jgi:primosomal protein N' (replication factor Y)
LSFKQRKESIAVPREVFNPDFTFLPLNSYNANMRYLEVLVAGALFHGDAALTYGYDRPLARGTVVVVPLRSKEVLGIVVAEGTKPRFAVKPLKAVPNWPLLPVHTLELLFWMKQYYPSSFGVITQLFLPKQVPKKPVEIPVFSNPPHPDLPALTTDQSAALKQIDGPGTYLLHGETGTGKTRLYIELAKQSVAAGKSALILTPEIGLTSQLAEDFRRVFKNNVIVMHSQLTQVTRQRLWVSLLQQDKPVILIGARSSLFSPLRNIGFIAIDEAHETAYKQDQAPYYHASRVASKLAALHKSSIVLGSATPLVGDYYLAGVKERPIVRMQQTASGTDTSDKKLTVIDLRDRAQFTRKAHLSDVLITAIGERLQKGEQTLLFLNRRGTARVIFCEECGWQSTCPHCDLPLIYHGDTHAMRCHSCEFKAASPSSCPNCHNASIVFKSIGTKAIVEETQRLFPAARIMRFDTDNKKDERIEQHYETVKNGDIDILIGTQTLAKGLDLPKLSLVGVIIADTSLYFPDFSAQERTYQLLSQVIGRVGRGHRAGEAIIQTYAPDSPLLQAILNKDWDTFYRQEISERKAFLFPPFCYLLKLTCRRASVAAAERAAKAFASKLETSPLRILVEGPAPSFHEKVQNKYGWQLVVKAKDRTELLRVTAMLPSGWSYDIDPMNLL